MQTIELYKGRCDVRFKWSFSNCECECNKSCDFAEYLDYLDYTLICNCTKRLIDKLDKKCYEDIDVSEMIYNVALYEFRLSKKGM